MTEEISIRKVQEKVDELIKDFGGYWTPLAMLASIMEEVGELSREINHLEGIKPKKPTEASSEIGDELGDLLFSLVCVANHYDVDLNEKFLSIIEKYKKRDTKRFLNTD